MSAYMSYLAWVLLLLFCNPSWSFSNPGFRAAITDKGLEYLNVVGVPLLKKELAALQIPDISGKTDITIGKLHYSLKKIHLTGFEIGSSSLMTSPGQGLTLKLKDISIGASADWSYKAIGISDHGSVTLSSGGLFLTIGILVGADTTGHPNIKCTGCSFDVGHLKVKIHGGASWFYNLFDGTISNTIGSSLNKHVCDLAISNINTAGNKALGSLPIVIQIDKVAELNYALTRSPNFNSSYIMTYHKGEFLSVTDPTIEAPFSPSSLPPFSKSGKMVSLWVTDYMANTAALVYKRDGYLNYNITPNMVAKLGPFFKLDTNTFSLLVPELYRKYPNKNMSIGIRAAEKPPFINITAEAANFTLPGTVDFYVLDGEYKPLAFSLGMMALVDMKASLNVDPKTNCLMLSANTTYLHADLRVLETNVGNIQISRIQNLLDVLSKAVITQINKYTNTGFPIPIVDGLHFISPSISLGKGYAVIETDINYSL